MENNELINNDNKIVVSLTTHSNRVKYVSKVIDSMINQTIKPYKIVLTLFKDDTKYIDDNLYEYFNKNNIDLIIGEEDIGPYAKYYYAMKKYKEYPIITIDDDYIYNKDLIQSLYKQYIKFPNCVSARRVHRIIYDKNCFPIPYNMWNFDFKSLIDTPSYDLFATGVGGVIYPPNILDIEHIKLEDIKECLYADDIFLKKIENELNIKVVYLANNMSIDGNEIDIKEVKEIGLWLTNNLKNRNDVYLKKINFKRKN